MRKFNTYNNSCYSSNSKFDGNNSVYSYNFKELTEGLNTFI